MLVMIRSACAARGLAVARSLALQMVLAGAGLLVWLAASVPASAYDGPKFRKGMWRFERVTEMLGRNPSMPGAMNVRVEAPVTRCVDPTEAMKETFRPASVGSCRSQPYQQKGNAYYFPMRCDYIGPVRTKVVVESDTAYREVHELTVGPAPRKEIIFARRVGDCDNYNLAAAEPLRLVPALDTGLMPTVSMSLDDD